jgi:hypothetical protein
MTIDRQTGGLDASQGRRGMGERRRPVREQETEYLDFAKIADASDYVVGMDTKPFLNTLKKDTKLGGDALGSLDLGDGNADVPMLDDDEGGGIIGGEDEEISAPSIEEPDDDTSDVEPSLPDQLGLIGKEHEIGNKALGSIPDKEGSTLPAFARGIIKGADRKLGDDALTSAPDETSTIPGTSSDRVIAPKTQKLSATAFPSSSDTEDKGAGLDKDNILKGANKELGAKSLEQRERDAVRRRRLERLRQSRKNV